jgi:hypothetical protein
MTGRIAAMAIKFGSKIAMVGKGCRAMPSLRLVRKNGDGGGDQIKVIVNKDYCLTQDTKRFINFQACDANDVKQLWVGFRTDVPFDLRPLEQDRDGIQRCMSQHHHPEASLIGQTAPKNKGNISRVLVAKCSLAIRVMDALSDETAEGMDRTIGYEEGRTKVEV